MNKVPSPTRIALPPRPVGTRSEQETAIRKALLHARDPEVIRVLHSWLDDCYVGDAHRRAADREIARLRRWLREAA